MALLIHAFCMDQIADFFNNRRPDLMTNTTANVCRHLALQQNRLRIRDGAWAIKGLALALALLLSAVSGNSFASDTSIDTDHVLVTIILKHQQDKSLSELQQIQDQNQFWQSFPPEGMVIESWYVAMGLGQIITLRVAPRDLRTLNLAVEKSAWGSFDTEFYPTYEFKGIAKQIKESKSAK